LAVQVIGVDAAVAEEDEDVLAIRHRRTGSVAVQGAVAGKCCLGQNLGYVAFPENLARAVEAYQVPLEILDVPFVALAGAVAGVAGEENPVADDDGAR